MDPLFPIVSVPFPVPVPVHVRAVRLVSDNVIQGGVSTSSQFACIHSMFAHYFYRPQTKFAKVMFLHLSVILFTGGGLSALVHAGIHANPPEQTPPEQTPPRKQTHPPAQCMLRNTGNKRTVCILPECILVIVELFKFQLELQKAANEAGYDMKLVAMETLSLREQALQITCSKVLVGVQGILLDISLADPTGTSVPSTPALLVQFLSCSWGFRQKSCQIIGFRPKLKIWSPFLRLANPGSATDLADEFCVYKNIMIKYQSFNYVWRKFSSPDLHQIYFRSF